MVPLGRVRGSLRHAVSTWVGLFGMLFVLGACVGVGIVALERQIKSEAVHEATSAGQGIARLTVQRNINPLQPGRTLTSASVRDLNGDVDQLVGGGIVLGLSVQRSDGTVIFGRGQRVSAAAFQGAVNELRGAGDPVAVKRTLALTSRRGSPRVSVYDVAIPLRSTASSTAGVVVGLVLPAKTFGSSTWLPQALTAIVVLVFVIAAAGLVLLRRRLLSREFAARHDPLTGLGNRSLLESTAEALLDSRQEVTLLLLDLDGFKRVNDTLGHAAGDELLGEIGGRMASGFRENDIVARMGGDEFAVLLPGLSSDSARAAAKRLLSVVQGNYVINGVALDAEASVGFATAPLDGTTSASCYGRPTAPWTRPSEASSGSPDTARSTPTRLSATWPCSWICALRFPAASSSCITSRLSHCNPTKTISSKHLCAGIIRRKDSSGPAGSSVLPKTPRSSIH